MHEEISRLHLELGWRRFSARATAGFQGSTHLFVCYSSLCMLNVGLRRQSRLVCLGEGEVVQTLVHGKTLRKGFPERSCDRRLRKGIC